MLAMSWTSLRVIRGARALLGSAGTTVSSQFSSLRLRHLPFSFVVRSREGTNILDVMPSEAMSSDLNWRNPQITGRFRTLDALHISTPFALNDRPFPGQFPHRRIPSKRIEANDGLPCGLPLNCYDPVWLRSLDEEEHCQVKEKPPVELIFSDSMAQYMIALSPRIPPLITNSAAPRPDLPP